MEVISKVYGYIFIVYVYVMFFIFFVRKEKFFKMCVLGDYIGI